MNSQKTPDIRKEPVTGPWVIGSIHLAHCFQLPRSQGPNSLQRLLLTHTPPTFPSVDRSSLLPGHDPSEGVKVIIIVLRLAYSASTGQAGELCPSTEDYGQSLNTSGCIDTVLPTWYIYKYILHTVFSRYHTESQHGSPRSVMFFPHRSSYVLRRLGRKLMIPGQAKKSQFKGTTHRDSISRGRKID